MTSDGIFTISTPHTYLQEADILPVLNDKLELNESSPLLNILYIL